LAGERGPRGRWRHRVRRSPEAEPPASAWTRTRRGGSRPRSAGPVRHGWFLSYPHPKAPGRQRPSGPIRQRSRGLARQHEQYAASQLCLRISESAKCRASPPSPGAPLKEILRCPTLRFTTGVQQRSRRTEHEEHDLRVADCPECKSDQEVSDLSRFNVQTTGSPRPKVVPHPLECPEIFVPRRRPSDSNRAIILRWPVARSAEGAPTYDLELVRPEAARACSRGRSDRSPARSDRAPASPVTGLTGSRRNWAAARRLLPSDSRSSASSPARKRKVRPRISSCARWRSRPSRRRGSEVTRPVPPRVPRPPDQPSERCRIYGSLDRTRPANRSTSSRWGFWTANMTNAPSLDDEHRRLCRFSVAAATAHARRAKRLQAGHARGPQAMGPVGGVAVVTDFGIARRSGGSGAASAGVGLLGTRTWPRSRSPGSQRRRTSMRWGDLRGAHRQDALPGRLRWRRGPARQQPSAPRSSFLVFRRSGTGRS
jgi:hypothetical protein